MGSACGHQKSPTVRFYSSGLLPVSNAVLKQDGTRAAPHAPDRVDSGSYKYAFQGLAAHGSQVTDLGQFLWVAARLACCRFANVIGQLGQGLVFTDTNAAGNIDPLVISLAPKPP